jgi:hypothetical protein
LTETMIKHRAQKAKGAAIIHRNGALTIRNYILSCLKLNCGIHFIKFTGH